VAACSALLSVTSRRAPRCVSSKLRGCSLGDRSAVVNDDDPVGELIGFLEMLSCEQNDRSAGGKLADDLPHPHAASGVETAVVGSARKSTDGRVIQTGSEVETAAHPTRVNLQHSVGGLDKVELLEQLAGSCACGAAPQSAQAADHPQVLPAREHLVPVWRPAPSR